MREKTLRWVAMMCFIAGMVMLFFVSRELDSETVGIGEIRANDLGDKVRVCGMVTEKFSSEGGHVFLRVEDETGGIKTAVFRDDVENLARYGIDVEGILVGDDLCLRGEVSEWEKEIEIVAEWLEA